jgi:putative ABC transport system permease protein
MAEWFPVSAGYFHTLGIPLLHGRDFHIQDSGSSLNVAIVNETMARRFWPDQNPVGKRLRIDMTNEQPREIVGVVADVRPDRSQIENHPQVYVPYLQQALVTSVGSLADRAGFFDTRFTMTFIVRASGDARALVPRFRAAVAEVDPNLPIFNSKTLDEYASDELWLTKLYMTLLSTFSGIAAVLALIGIYGITAYAVRQRTREIGIRMALGASPARVLRLMIGRGLLLIGLGIVFGLAAALALTKLMQSLLWGITATDPLTFGAVVMMLATVSLLACYVPARRALTMEPTVVLRHE